MYTMWEFGGGSTLPLPLQGFRRHGGGRVGDNYMHDVTLPTKFTHGTYHSPAKGNNKKERIVELSTVVQEEHCPVHGSIHNHWVTNPVLPCSERSTRGTVQYFTPPRSA